MKKIVLTLIILPLMGCQHIVEQKNQYIRNRSKDYITSCVIAPLRIPEDLCYPGMTENYPVPEDLPPIGQLCPVSLVPPGFGIISEVAVEES